MKMNLWLVGVLFCVSLVSCGGYDNGCTINAVVTPATTTADHATSTRPVPSIRCSMRENAARGADCTLSTSKGSFSQI